MPTSRFADRSTAEAWLADKGFRHQPVADVWEAGDGHTLGYVVQEPSGFVVNVTVNRTGLPTTKSRK